MSAELDPDLELVRKLHLELNGSGRRTRGAAPPPTKRYKRESSRPLSESQKDTPAASRSASGSGSARVVKREGTLKRLVKKQTDSDSNQQTVLEDDGTTIDLAQNVSLEPQASIKATEKRQLVELQRGGDGGARADTGYLDHDAMKAASENAANLARIAAARDAGRAFPRVKCFYQGYPYGFSFDQGTLNSRTLLAEALKAALASESVQVGSADELEVMVLDSEGNQNVCTAQESASCWQTAVKAAKRVYIHSAAAGGNPV